MSVVDEMAETINAAVRIAREEDLTGYRCWCETCCYLRDRFPVAAPEPTEKGR